ncbi:MAG: SurA N-terminal domain-containing protein [Burkholderiales bacterium]|nr:SurA N-terminal domain-containing protein [Burkholderiales bacterium]
MFDFVRKHKRLMQAILALVILPFAFFGIESYQRFVGLANEVAEVDGSPIGIAEFNQALERQKEQLRAVLGGNVDSSVLDSPTMRQELLDQLVTQRVLQLYAAKRNLGVSDEALRETILAIPAFQENGVFSKERYEQLLRGQNLTPAMFEALLRQDLTQQQVAAAIAESAFVARTAARDFAALRAEQREVAEVVFPPAQFAAQVKVTPEAIEKFYAENRRDFEVPEQVRVEYVVLSPETLAVAGGVTPAEAKAWYEQHLPQYQQPETRQASHILIAAGADPKERAAARQKAEEVVRELRANPAKFAELAKKLSQDPGSAAQGGDLGAFGRGAMVKPFEDAVFSLKPNQVSDPVETEFGFHVIKVTAVRPERTVPFEDVRPEIERELAKQRAGRQFAEAAEAFTNLAYEQPDSLKPLVDKFKLRAQTSGWIARDSETTGPLANPKLRAAVFAADAIKERRNTDAVEIGPSTLAVARVVEHRPATVRPLEDVRTEVEARLRQQEALAAAQRAANERLDQLRAGGAADTKWSAPRLVSRENPAGLRPDAVRAVFQVDPAKLPAYVATDLGPGGFAIYRVTRVAGPAAADEARVRAAEAGLARQAAGTEYQAFVQGLKSRAKIEVNKENLQRKGG